MKTGMSESVAGTSSTKADDGKSVTLTDAAARGSVWLSGQWLINKICAAAATLLVVYFVTPEAYGVAMTAISIAAYMEIAKPEILGKVLLAHTKHLEWFSGAGRRLSWGIGVAGTILTLVVILVLVVM